MGYYLRGRAFLLYMRNKLGTAEDWIRLRGVAGQRFSASEVAEALGVAPSTVIGWIERGLLNATWSDALGCYRVRRRSVRRMLADIPEVSNVVAKAQIRKEHQ